MRRGPRSSGRHGRSSDKTQKVDSVLQLVVFRLHDQLYALRLEVVDRIVRIAEITALPSAPDIVLGVINIQGRVIPVVDPCPRFGLPQRELELSDQLIIARTSRRAIGLLVAGVEGVVDCPRSQLSEGQAILANSRYVEGVLKREDGLIMIHDLDSFLSPLEDRNLAHALASA
jgi:purine-binding chemotaxis protein CheW